MSLTSSECVDILLIVDQKWRDLPGMAALAEALAAAGLTSELVPFPLWRYALSRKRPQMMVLTHMNGPRSRAIADAATRCGTRVAILHTEGRPGNPQGLAYGNGRDVDARGVDLWFTWSDVVRDYMLAEGVVPPDRAVTVGVPRFDLYREPLNALLIPRDEFAGRLGFDPSKPIVTWATNFTHAPYGEPSNHYLQEFLVRDWTALGLIKHSLYSQPIQFARADYEARERSLDAMRTVLRARPAVQLALKPHPHERHDRYERWVNECRAEFGPRVAFTGLAYIGDVLNMADVHVHRMCMTGVEAWFFDRPSLDLHLLDYFSLSLDLEGANTEAIAGNDLVQQPEALIERLDHYLAGGGISSAQRQAREAYTQRWFHAVDGRRCDAHAAVFRQAIEPRRAIVAQPLSAGTLRAYGQVAFNRLMRHPLWAPISLRPPQAADRLGQIDNLITDDDVNLWRRKVRGAREQYRIYGGATQTPAMAGVR